MAFIIEYEQKCKYLVREIPYSFLQAGIYLDRLTLANMITNVRIISEYCRNVHHELAVFLERLEEETEKRKTKDKRIREILEDFYKTVTILILFQKELHDFPLSVWQHKAERPEYIRTGMQPLTRLIPMRSKLLKARSSVYMDRLLIPNLKKKEMEIPGERKKIEDEKNFQAAKKELKNRYSQLEQRLEQNELEKHFLEIKERLFAPELLLPYLRGFSRPIGRYIGNSYAEMKKPQLLATIDLYLGVLIKLSESISQELTSMLLVLKGEMAIWRNVRKNLEQLNAGNYSQIKAQLLKLLQDDAKIYSQIEAA